MNDLDLVDRYLGFAISDARTEREHAIAWLLAHPDQVRPQLIERVERGEAESPEFHLRLLAVIGGEGAVVAATTALERAHRGESFWAAQALADLGPAGRAVLRLHAEDHRPEVREAVRHAERSGTMYDGAGGESEAGDERDDASSTTRGPLR